MKRDKLDKLRDVLKGYEKVLVAFSGGVDSSFLLNVAHQELGSGLVALTACSPTYTSEEVKRAKEFCRDLGILHVICETNEMDEPNFASNPPDRCYFCKRELYTICHREAKKLEIEVVASADNLDDLQDYRPGLNASADFDVKTPLIEARLTKQDIRSLSKEMGLATWDKESIACLASRIPYGTAIKKEVLEKIARIEIGLRALGLRYVRARYHDDNLIRIEVHSSDLTRLSEEKIRKEILNLCKGEGFKFTTLDLEGYRMGSFNSLVTSKKK